MNPVPDRISDRPLQEIPTNTEGKSWWLDKRSFRVYDAEGDDTDFRCHYVKQALPGFVQEMNFLGFPFDDTADFVRAEFTKEIALSLDGVEVTLVDFADRLTNLAPCVDEFGNPAHWYHIVCRRKGKQIDHAIAMLIMKLLGNRTSHQAFLTNVEETVNALQDGSGE